MAVVFDGAPETNLPDGSSYRGVKIFYARHGSDADTRIVEIAERERNRRGLIVVTSDGALAARVRACGVRVMRSGEFRRQLDAIPAGGAGQAEPQVRDDEMSEWLRYFGVAEDDDESDDEA